MILITGEVNSTSAHRIKTINIEGNTKGLTANLVALEYHDVATLYSLMAQEEHGKVKELLTNLLLTFK